MKGIRYGRIFVYNTKNGAEKKKVDCYKVMDKTGEFELENGKEKIAYLITWLSCPVGFHGETASCVLG